MKEINRVKGLVIENMDIDEFLETVRFDERVNDKYPLITTENNITNPDIYKC